MTDTRNSHYDSRLLSLGKDIEPEIFTVSVPSATIGTTTNRQDTFDYPIQGGAKTFRMIKLKHSDESFYRPTSTGLSFYPTVFDTDIQLEVGFSFTATTMTVIVNRYNENAVSSRSSDAFTLDFEVHNISPPWATT